MRPAILSFFSIAVLAVASLSQTANEEPKTAEFVSPVYEQVSSGRQTLSHHCFSFKTERFSGGENSDICYGGLRAGEQWDWFQTMGEGSRNNLKKIGKKNWDDDFKIPVVKPYAKLKPGEQRSIVLNSSGRSGYSPRRQPIPLASDGPRSEGLTDASEILDREVGAATVVSAYKAYLEAESGKMYVMRVVDDKADFYVLFRVEELERGKRCKISWKRIDAPQED